MTSTLRIADAPAARRTRRRRTAAVRAREWLVEHRVSVMLLGALLLVAGFVHANGMADSPQRADDEGTYVAQAYAIQYYGELAHYTFWYDHPPLGWLQISAWTTLTDAFDRTSPAVLAGRELMLLTHLASAALLWVLARRIELSRAAAAAAVLLFSLSPLAVAYHRMVFLDNIATPWLLAAFVLGSPSRHQLASHCGAAACFVMAILTKETYLLMLPALVWWIWRGADPQTRRYTLTAAGSLFAMLGLGYVVFAVLKSELLPDSRSVSLLDGIAFQLVEREGSGSVFDRASQAGDTVEIWLRLDTVLPVAATIAAVAMLGVRRLQPLAAAYLVPLAMMLRPGYLPVPYVIAMFPFAALLVAAAIDLAVRRGSATRVVGIAAAAAALVVAVPAWSAGLNGLATNQADQPMQKAEEWLDEHAGRDQRLLIDDAIWVDLVHGGRPRDNVVWYYKADADPEVIETTPHGWQDYDYLVVSESVRRSLEDDQTVPGGGAYPVVAGAFRRSVVVAEFGQGNQRVQIRAVEHQGRR